MYLYFCADAQIIYITVTETFSRALRAFVAFSEFSEKFYAGQRRFFLKQVDIVVRLRQNGSTAF